MPPSSCWARSSAVCALAPLALSLERCHCGLILGLLGRDGRRPVGSGLFECGFRGDIHGQLVSSKGSLFAVELVARGDFGKLLRFSDGDG